MVILNLLNLQIQKYTQKKSTKDFHFQKKFWKIKKIPPRQKCYKVTFLKMLQNNKKSS